MVMEVMVVTAMADTDMAVDTTEASDLLMLMPMLIMVMATAVDMDMVDTVDTDTADTEESAPLMPTPTL